MTAPGRPRKNPAAGLGAELAAAEESPAEKPVESPQAVSMSPEELEALLNKARAEAFAQGQQQASALESDDAPELPNVDPNDASAVTVHFLDDGFTALGRVWYRGEQITVSKNSKEWEEDGRHWMKMTEYDQIKKYGKRLFGHGEWPYSGYDLDDPDLDPKEREILKRANAQRVLNPKRRIRNNMVVGG